MFGTSFPQKKKIERPCSLIKSSTPPDNVHSSLANNAASYLLCTDIVFSKEYASGVYRNYRRAHHVRKSVKVSSVAIYFDLNP